jgi:hypothetical protein
MKAQFSTLRSSGVVMPGAHRARLVDGSTIGLGRDQVGPRETGDKGERLIAGSGLVAGVRWSVVPA